MKLLFLLLLFFCFSLNGEQTIYERQKELNETLVRLIESGLDDGKTHEEMGSLYFQLQEYPLAILHYNQALKFYPENSAIISQLNRVQSKLGLPLTSHSFLPSYQVSLTLFSWVGILAIGCLSILIWKRSVMWRRLSQLFIGLGIILVLYSVGTYYFSPLEGIILRPTLLYRGAGDQYSIVSDVPLVSGMKVRVISVENNGYWLKVMASDGKIGYVDYKVIRLI